MFGVVNFSAPHEAVQSGRTSFFCAQTLAECLAGYSEKRGSGTLVTFGKIHGGGNQISFDLPDGGKPPKQAVKYFVYLIVAGHGGEGKLRGIFTRDSGEAVHGKGTGGVPCQGIIYHGVEFTNISVKAAG